MRLYSIASSRYGDSFDGKTATLCVRRATYWDAEMGKEDPAKKGICSNFLCDAKPGTKIAMTGAQATQPHSCACFVAPARSSGTCSAARTLRVSPCWR